MTPEDTKSEKFQRLYRLIGHEYFQNNVVLPQCDDVKIEEIGEEIDEDDVVDIDIDPDNINEEEAEVIKALYLEQNYEELDDDFMLKANLDDVLGEYEDEAPEPVPTVMKNELDAALDEFITEHKQMFVKETNKILGIHFEGIPFEQDHVLIAAIERESSSDKTPEESESSECDDVVSHASQFTNTDNRPVVLSLRERKPRKEKKNIPEEKEKEDEKEIDKEKESGKRIRTETKEEKKMRKDKIKADKKIARDKKRVLKEMYKSEKVKLDTKDVGTYDVRQGTSVIKLG